METIEHTNSRFLPELPRSEPAIFDHTSFIKAKTCKRLYFYTMVLGFRERKTAIYFNFGIAYHRFREALERAAQSGTEPTEALKTALRTVIETWKREQGQDPPVGTKYDYMTLERLLASCKEAFNWWLRERQLGRIEVLPEFIEKHLVVTLKDGKTKIGARVDQLVRWVGKLWGRDFKTSSRMGKFYDRTLEPNDQFTRQQLIETKLSGEHVQGVLVEVLYNTKKEGPEIVGFTTTRSPDQLSRWEDEQCFLAEELERNRLADMWPMEEKQCPYCPFRIVCAAPNERAMAAQLKSNFDHSPWNFYKEGSDDDAGGSDSSTSSDS